MKRKIAVFICLSLMLAAVPAFDVAYAQQGPGKGKHGAPAREGRELCFPPNINLTQEQTTKLQDVHNTFFKDTVELRSGIFKQEQDMAVLMLEKTIDAEKAKTLQDEISGLQAQIAQKRLQARLDSRKVLTPEQIGQLPAGCTMGIGPDGTGCGFGPDGGKRAGGNRR